MFAAPRSNPIIASPRRELANSIEFISQNVVRLVKPLRKIIIPKRSDGDRRLYPPTGLKVDLVTPHTADLVSTATNPNFSYRARYWPKGQPALARECTSQKNSCRLEQLDLETTYYSILYQNRTSSRSASVPDTQRRLKSLIRIVSLAASGA